MIGVVGVLGLSALGNIVSPSEDDSTTTAQSTIRPTESPTVAPTRTPGPTVEPTPTEVAFRPTGSTETATVARVIDGDTIVVDIDGQEFRLRYIGMDTPEPDAKEVVIKELAAASTGANTRLVSGRQVTLERDVSETDRFDRLLRNVWVESASGALIMVGLELVRSGYAQVSTYPPDVKYVDLLTEAQEAARTSGVGLWAPSPTATPTPTASAAPTPIAVAERVPPPAEPETNDCHPSYKGACLKPDAGDYDCASGSGNGPNYIRGPIRVVGYDDFDLDRDGDGIGCD